MIRRLLYMFPSVAMASLATLVITQQEIEMLWGLIVLVALIGYVVVSGIHAWRGAGQINHVHQNLAAHDAWERAERNTAITMFATVQRQLADLRVLLEKKHPPEGGV